MSGVTGPGVVAAGVDDDELAAVVALSGLPGVGPARLRALLAHEAEPAPERKIGQRPDHPALHKRHHHAARDE